VSQVASDPDTHELALPLVVRLERATPPLRTDALEAAARAVLLILTGGRPEWADAIARWDAHRIRKVVRRARGAHWARAQELDGLTVEHGSAQVRVYPPVPVDDWPPDLARLQVGGTNLDPDEPGPVRPGTPLVLLSPHAEMSTGKAMAQAGHAAQLGWRALDPASRVRWQDERFPLAVREATAGQWARALADGAVVVHDGGFTEVAPGTATALFVA